MSFSYSPTLFEEQYKAQAPYTEAAEKDRWSQVQWMRTLYPASQMFQGLFQAPSLQGQPIPYQQYMKPGLYPEGMQTTFGQENLSPGMKYLQDFYTNRSYGLSDNLASAMSAQAMEPIRLGDLGSVTPAGMSRQATPDPQKMITAAIRSQFPMSIDPLDRLAASAELSQIGAWQAKQVPEMIG